MKNWKAESSLYWKTSRKIILKTGLSIADMLDNFSKAAITSISHTKALFSANFYVSTDLEME
jgi:hypothetical protein